MECARLVRSLPCRSLAKWGQVRYGISRDSDKGPVRIAALSLLGFEVKGLGFRVFRVEGFKF